MRLCGSSDKIDKSRYGKLTKVALSVGTSLEYGNDGVLTLTKDLEIPRVWFLSNLKLKKMCLFHRVNWRFGVFFKQRCFPRGRVRSKHCHH